MISPFAESAVVRGMSFGLSAASYDVRIAESVTIYPGEFVLASTAERFHVPNDVLIVVHDKSSWARRGMMTQNTVLDPGFIGHVTLELTNHGRSALVISAGDPIAQVVCHLLTEATAQPYSGKYQNQEAGPQHARDDGPGVTMTDRAAAMDSVNSPPHYKRGDLEVIDVIEAFELNFRLGKSIIGWQ